MIATRKTTCCGLREIYGITNESGIDVIFRVSRLRLKTALILFTDTVKTLHGGALMRHTDYYGNPRGGVALADFIQKNNLGEVTQSEPVLNQNSGNIICGWFWKVDWPQLITWSRDHNTYPNRHG